MPPRFLKRIIYLTLAVLGGGLLAPVITYATLTLDSTSLTSDTALTLKSASSSAINFGHPDQSGTVTIASTTQALTLDIGKSTSVLTISIGSGTGGHTVNIATGTSSAKTINIGTGASTLNTITIGGASSTLSIGGNTTLGSASATPVILVLGNKNTSGDPTCTAGAVYYNSSQTGYEQTKVCLGGAWVAAGAPYVTSLPTTPADGDEVYYKADATNGVIWHLRYNAGSASTYKWEYLGGSPLTSYVATNEGTNSVTYAALPTAGPSVTVPNEGDYWIEISARISRNASGVDQAGYMSYDIGATGATEADAIGANFTLASTAVATTNSRSKLKTAIAASTAITAKYRVTGGNGAFDERTMRITPVRIK